MSNPTANLGFQNWYQDSLSQACGASDTTIYLNNPPTPSEGYLIIDPLNASTREVIHYTSKSSNSVTLAATSDRGLDGTTAQSHAQNTTVVMDVTASMFTALQSGYGMNVGWHAYTTTMTGCNVGNGTLSAQYLQIGKLVWVQVKFILGSTSTNSVSGTRTYFSPPVTGVDPGIGSTKASLLQAQETYVQGGTIVFASPPAGWYNNNIMSAWTLGLGITGPGSLTPAANDVYYGSFLYQAA